MSKTLIIDCANCDYTFTDTDAKLCEGCRYYNCGCRSVGEDCRCKFYYTLVCPSCKQCCCSHVGIWKRKSQLVEIDHPVYHFIHKHLVTVLEIEGPGNDD